MITVISSSSLFTESGDLKIPKTAYIDFENREGYFIKRHCPECGRSQYSRPSSLCRSGQHEYQFQLKRAYNAEARKRRKEAKQ